MNSPEYPAQAPPSRDWTLRLERVSCGRICSHPWVPHPRRAFCDRVGDGNDQRKKEVHPAACRSPWKGTASAGPPERKKDAASAAEGTRPWAGWLTLSPKLLKQRAAPPLRFLQGWEMFIHHSASADEDLPFKSDQTSQAMLRRRLSAFHQFELLSPPSLAANRRASNPVSRNPRAGPPPLRFCRSRICRGVVARADAQSEAPFPGFRPGSPARPSDRVGEDAPRRAEPRRAGDEE